MHEEFVKEFQIIDRSELENDFDLLENINLVQKNLANIYNNMQFADSDLIDYYTYQLKAEESKYNYLIKQIKKRKLIKGNSRLF